MTTILIDSVTVLPNSTEDTLTAFTGEAVNLLWFIPPEIESTLKLEADSIKDYVFYRMDAAPQARDKLFIWETDVIADVNAEGTITIEPGDLGFTATLQVGNTSIYLPLGLSMSNKVDGQDYLFLVTPDAKLTGVSSGYGFLTRDLNSLNAIDIKNFKLNNMEPLNYGSYPADTPIEVFVPVKDLEQDGFYVLRISGSSAQDDSPVNESFVFYHEND